MRNLEGGPFYTALQHAIINANGYASMALLKFAVENRKYIFIIEEDTFRLACNYFFQSDPDVLRYMVTNCQALNINFEEKRNQISDSVFGILMSTSLTECQKHFLTEWFQKMLPT